MLANDDERVGPLRGAGSSISQTTWIGFSTRAFFGTWMNTPPVQKAAVPAANLSSS